MRSLTRLKSLILYTGLGASSASCWRYVNSPESLINGVHLESGPSGRFQVVITVEIGDVLCDTIN